MTGRDQVEEFDIVGAFKQVQLENPDMSMPIVAVKALVMSIQATTASTVWEATVKLNNAAATLAKISTNKIAVKAGCSLYLRYSTRLEAVDSTASWPADLDVWKQNIIQKGELLWNRSEETRQDTVDVGVKFIKDDITILVHSYSRVVMKTLITAASQGKRFKVIVTEAGPECHGRRAVVALREHKIPAALIGDAAVGYTIEKVDMVLVGAEAIMQNGGLVNQIGTNQIAIVAKAANKPFYAITESYKFTHFFPLNQSDLEVDTEMHFNDQDDAGKIRTNDPTVDYTPPTFISLYFTNIGVLTPSGVAEHLVATLL
eukprot:jgi/Hompol1/395/HPOL_001326-RA